MDCQYCDFYVVQNTEDTDGESLMGSGICTNEDSPNFNQEVTWQDNCDERYWKKSPDPSS